MIQEDCHECRRKLDFCICSSVVEKLKKKNAAYEVLLEKQLASTLDHTFPLRPDLSVQFRGLPVDLKKAEADRLVRFLMSLVSEGIIYESV